MKNKYLVKYSNDGRITIPREVRGEIKIPGGKGVDLLLYINKGKIIIEPPTNRCQFCGIKTDNKVVIDKSSAFICKECCSKISKINTEL